MNVVWVMFYLNPLQSNLLLKMLSHDWTSPASCVFYNCAFSIIQKIYVLSKKGEEILTIYIFSFFLFKQIDCKDHT